jgi:pimeloyl-ACP methyl ester carboxylesterase
MANVLEKTRISIGDMQVTVEGSGPTLVFCHGFTTTAQFWREQMASFSACYRLVVLDLPGHGISPAPRDRRYTMDAFVGDLELVFRELGIEQAILVGLSMGATIAQRFALRNPELLEALVLVGATPHGLGADVKFDNVIANIDALGVEQASQNVIERSFGSATSPSLLEFARQEVIQTPAFVAKEAITSLNESDTRAQLHQITLPTLVICGAEDLITPVDESRTLAAEIPNAELAIISKAAHFPMLEQPSQFNAVLGHFIKRILKTI